MSESVSTPAESKPDAWPAFLRRLMWLPAALMLCAAIPFVAPFSSSADRTLYFKLPIEGAEFHWRFLDREAFLSGELTLRILNKGREQTLVVFRDGKIHDGWEMIGKPSREGAFYFGFSTKDRVRTRMDDSLIITLKTTKDLHGQGPYSEGVLAAGVWQMSGTYSSMYGGRWSPMDLIVLHGKPPIAFMECWAGVWPITVTKNEGWGGVERKQEVGLLRRISPERGTNGRLCRSHI